MGSMRSTSLIDSVSNIIIERWSACNIDEEVGVAEVVRLFNICSYAGMLFLGSSPLVLKSSISNIVSLDPEMNWV